MKKILTLDDFYIFHNDNVRRIMMTPEWNYKNEGKDALTPSGYYGTIMPLKTGGYHASISYCDDDEQRGNGAIMCSHDGLHFEKCQGAVNMGGEGFIDPSDAEYPYKGTQNAGGGYVWHSKDALTWEKITEREMIPGAEMDCLVSCTYNPHTKKYMASLRRNQGDRRISIVESDDMTTWSKPYCALHPGTPLDAPRTHFYSMPLYYSCEMDIFVGLLWKIHMPYGKISNGPMTTELVYSYDGSHWNRTLHTLMPIKHPACQADIAPEAAPTGLAWLTSIIERENDMLLYATVGDLEHRTRTPDGGGKLWNRHYMHTVVGKLRKDGFSCYRAGEEEGEAATVAIRPMADDDRLFLNYRTRSDGYVKVALFDIYGNPVDGFGFDDSHTPCGDFTKCELSWKGGTWKDCIQKKMADSHHDDDTRKVAAWCILKIRFSNADIFSITGDFYAVVNTNGILYDRP